MSVLFIRESDKPFKTLPAARVACLVRACLTRRLTTDYHWAISTSKFSAHVMTANAKNKCKCKCQDLQNGGSECLPLAGASVVWLAARGSLAPIMSSVFWLTFNHSNGTSNNFSIHKLTVSKCISKSFRRKPLDKTYHIGPSVSSNQPLVSYLTITFSTSISINFDVGVWLLSATEFSGTNTLASGNPAWRECCASGLSVAHSCLTYRQSFDWPHKTISILLCLALRVHATLMVL